MNLYAKAGILFFDGEYDFDPFYEKVWLEHPSGKSAYANALSASSGLYRTDQYKVKDLSYLIRVPPLSPTRRRCFPIVPEEAKRLPAPSKPMYTGSPRRSLSPLMTARGWPSGSTPPAAISMRSACTIRILTELCGLIPPLWMATAPWTTRLSLSRSAAQRI